MCDSDFEVVDSIQALQSKVDSLQQQLDAAGDAAITATERHEEELDKEKTAHVATKASLEKIQQELAVKDRAYNETVAAKDSLVADLRGQIAASQRTQLQTTEAVEEKAAHEATNASLATLQEVANEVLKALVPDKDLMCEVLAFIRGKKITSEAIMRAKSVCTAKMKVEKNMTAMGIFSLGCQLLEDETVTINGTLYTDKDCFLKALEIDPRHASSYIFLASRMIDDETVTIDGTLLTKKDCSIKALEIDPTNKWAWKLLGEMIKKTEETVHVSGVYYTKGECLAKGRGPFH